MTSQTNTSFLVLKKDTKQHMCIEWPIEPLRENEVLLEIEKFSFTSNNITYAVLGETFLYFDFWPTIVEGWGSVCCWGLARVVESKHEKISVGERIYGFVIFLLKIQFFSLQKKNRFYPTSKFYIFQPQKFVENSFYVKRDHLPEDRKVYNQYHVTTRDPFYSKQYENEMLLLRPLFLTSFFLNDFLRKKEFFGADDVVISSASSKTSYGLAFLLNSEEEKLFPHDAGDSLEKKKIKGFRACTYL
eukprot:TRINITY_DN8906_c0_g1_i1.p1 TRINITY_DN8906_c0_g1~~TRINITY_DN8906_c0_g1_i1.p1  ORF type:complete len:255 (-),score=57.40 TRINITY_DN8906_c0_g1_i1:848-1582(-)